MAARIEWSAREGAIPHPWDGASTAPEPDVACVPASKLRVLSAAEASSLVGHLAHQVSTDIAHGHAVVAVVGHAAQTREEEMRPQAFGTQTVIGVLVTDLLGEMAKVYVTGLQSFPHFWRSSFYLLNDCLLEKA